MSGQDPIPPHAGFSSAASPTVPNYPAPPQHQHHGFAPGEHTVGQPAFPVSPMHPAAMAVPASTAEDSSVTSPSTTQLSSGHPADGGSPVAPVRQSAPPSADAALVEQYTVLERIGEGNYGHVYRVRDRRTGKVMSLKRLKSNCSYAQFLRELAIIQRLNHPRLLRCHEILPPQDNSGPHGRPRIITDYAPLNLYEYASVFPSCLMPLRQLQAVMRGLLEGLVNMHANRIMHRDIKPENLLVRIRQGEDPQTEADDGGATTLADAASAAAVPKSENDLFVEKTFQLMNDGELRRQPAAQALCALAHLPQVQIADFGSARVAGDEPAGHPKPSRAHTPRNIVTAAYRAMEVLLEGHYSLEIDVWAAGAVFAELAVGLQPFAPETRDQSVWGQMVRVMRIMGTPTEAEWNAMAHPSLRGGMDVSAFPKFTNNLDTEFGGALPVRLGALGMDLLRKMLRYVPSERISAVEALRHPFMSVVFSPAAMMADNSIEVMPKVGSVLAAYRRHGDIQGLLDGDNEKLVKEALRLDREHHASAAASAIMAAEVATAPTGQAAS